jgi:hypothetical protein
MEQSSTAQQSREAQDERKADQPREASRRRFRIVKLEERIAPILSPSSNPCASTATHSSTRFE